MRSASSLLVAFAVLAMLVGCGAGGSSGPDARPDEFSECWPEIARKPRGSAVLGTGRDAYEDMPEVLALEYGVQDGYNLVAHVRMDGIIPGDPSSPLEDANPRTRIRAFFDD